MPSASEAARPVGADGRIAASLTAPAGPTWEEKNMARTIAKAGFDLGVVTTNGDAMLEFYRDVVGLEFEATMAIEAPRDRPDGPPALQRQHAEAGDPHHRSARGQGRGNPRMHGVALSHDQRDDVEAAVADCEAAGAPIVWPPQEARPGVKIAMVEDPDGNWLEFIQMS